MKYSQILGLLGDACFMVQPSYMQSVLGALQNHGMNLEIGSSDPAADYEMSARLKRTFKAQSLADVHEQFLMLPGSEGDEDNRPSLVQNTEGVTVAIVPVIGSLFQRQNTMNSGSSVGRGYNAIKNEIYIAMQDADVNGVAMVVDSPGGQASGNMDLSRWIRKVQADFGKPIWAIANDTACSAAYNIGSAAEHFVATDLAVIGSVGALYTHIDQSESNKKKGLKISYIKSGEKKDYGNSNGPLTGAAFEEVQNQIEAIASAFFQTVADHRGKTVESIKAMEAGVFLADEALKLGLIDAVQTSDEFFQSFFEHLTNTNPETEVITMPGESKPTQKTSKDETELSTVHDRYRVVMSHPAAATRMDAALQYAQSDIPIESVTMMMDSLAEADLAVAEAVAAAGNSEQVKKPAISAELKAKLGIQDESQLSDSQVSILTMLAPVLGSPEVPADISDPLSQESIDLSAGEPKTDPADVSDLSKKYGAQFGAKRKNEVDR